ncbi:MAG: hypothetical protein M3N19_11330 [Candidatus Eremiobacteraeota bacterium]|nr:hypothetical protein [Candidatus Eremiobacteraeota bacterium]
MNIKALIATGTLATALIAGAASAQTVTLPNGTSVTGPMNQQQSNGQMGTNLRGERGSRHNIASVRRHEERLIDQLQRDRHDYGGHRVQAIELMQQARAQLLLAEQYDQAHPGQ